MPFGIEVEHIHYIFLYCALSFTCDKYFFFRCKSQSTASRRL